MFEGPVYSLPPGGRTVSTKGAGSADSVLGSTTDPRRDPSTNGGKTLRLVRPHVRSTGRRGRREPELEGVDGPEVRHSVRPTRVSAGPGPDDGRRPEDEVFLLPEGRRGSRTGHEGESEGPGDGGGSDGDQRARARARFLRETSLATRGFVGPRPSSPVALFEVFEDDGVARRGGNSVELDRPPVISRLTQLPWTHLGDPRSDSPKGARGVVSKGVRGRTTRDP